MPRPSPRELARAAAWMAPPGDPPPKAKRPAAGDGEAMMKTTQVDADHTDPDGAVQAAPSG